MLIVATKRDPASQNRLVLPAADQTQPNGNCICKVYVVIGKNYILYQQTDGFDMITAAQLRAARSLAGLDQRKLAELSGLSLPTIQRMETSEDVVRGNVNSLTKLIAAFDSIGVEFLGEGVVGSTGGRGVRFKNSANLSSDSWVLAPGGPGIRAKKSAAASRASTEVGEATQAVSSSREER